jgi:hypothetical protein
MVPFRRLAALLLLLASPSSLPAAEDGMSAYKHKTEGFSLRYPSDWEAKEDMNYELYKIPFLAVRPLEGENDVIRENMNVINEKVAVKLTLEGYAKANLKMMPKSLQAFERVDEGPLTGGRAPSRFLIYTHRYGENDLKVVVFFYRKGAKGYAVSCTSSPERFKDHWELFQKIGRSFMP